jgi:hypothetical protein
VRENLPGFAPRTGCGDAKRHIGVFGIGDDEGFAARRVGADVCELCVERFDCVE